MAYYVGYLPKEHEYFKHPIVRNIHNSTQIKQNFFAALMNITESYCLVEKFEKSSRIYSNMFYKELFKNKEKIMKVMFPRWLVKNVYAPYQQHYEVRLAR